MCRPPHAGENIFATTCIICAVGCGCVSVEVKWRTWQTKVSKWQSGKNNTAAASVQRAPVRCRDVWQIKIGLCDRAGHTSLVVWWLRGVPVTKTLAKLLTMLTIGTGVIAGMPRNALECSLSLARVASEG